MSNPKNLDYWRNPRESIASKFREDDIAYSVSGMHAAATVLKYINMSLLELGKKDILDFGCGTGRVSRALALFFKKVIGYDPVQACILQAVQEGESFPLRPLSYTTVLSEESAYDFACSVSVVEHLSLEDQRKAFDLMKWSVKPQGKIILWYASIDNSQALEEAFPGQKRTCGMPGIYIDSFIVNK